MPRKNRIDVYKRQSVERMKNEGEKIPAFVEEMLNNGFESFYKEDDSGALSYLSLIHI